MYAGDECPRGVVHGKVIQLETEIGLSDGQEVTVRPLSDKRAATGAWADDPDGLDAYLQENRRARQLDPPATEP